MTSRRKQSSDATGRAAHSRIATMAHSYDFPGRVRTLDRIDPGACDNSPRMKSPRLRLRLAIATIAAAATCAALAADEETPAIVARSDIAIGQPNVLPMQAMGLGNGRLGAAFWAADGLTLHLNRADTLPYRRVFGQVVFPDLKPLVADRGFSGRVDLYDGVLEESGGSITLRAWVDRFVDRVVIDLSGLPTGIEQRVQLHLWEPRQPIASTDERTASLAETWRDDRLPGRSGRSFGSLAAITTNGRERHARIVDPRTVEVASLPNIDGRLRVIVAAPAFDDSRNAPELVRTAFETDADPHAAQLVAAFWKRVDRFARIE
jgi:hypothetical protein